MTGQAEVASETIGGPTGHMCKRQGQGGRPAARVIKWRHTSIIKLQANKNNPTLEGNHSRLFTVSSSASNSQNADFMGLPDQISKGLLPIDFKTSRVVVTGSSTILSLSLTNLIYAHNISCFSLEEHLLAGSTHRRHEEARRANSCDSVFQ